MKRKPGDFFSLLLTAILILESACPLSAFSAPPQRPDTLRGEAPPESAGLEELKAEFRKFARSAGFLPQPPVLAVPVVTDSAGGLEEKTAVPIWSIPPVRLELNSRNVSSLHIGSDGVVHISNNHVLVNWNPENESLNSTVSCDRERGESIYKFGFDQETGRLLGASNLRRIYCWDPATGKAENAINLTVNPTLEERFLAFSPSGKRLVSQAEFQPALLLRDVETGKIQTRFFVPEKIQTAAVSADDRLLAVATGATIRLWDLAPAGSLLRRLTLRSEPVLLHQILHEGVRHLVFSPNGRTLASITKPGNVFLWDVETGRLTADVSIVGRVTALAFHPQGHVLACGDDVGKIHLVRVADGRVLARLQGSAQVVSALAFDPRGATLIAVGEHADQWPVERILQLSKGGEKAVNDLKEIWLDRIRASRSFSERLEAAEGLLQTEAWVPAEAAESFRILPTAGAQQAAMIWVYRYQRGRVTLPQLLQEMERLRQWEEEAIRRKGPDRLIGLELHTSIARTSTEGTSAQRFYDFVMRVPLNQDGNQQLRIETIFEEGGLEIQTLPSHSPEVQAAIWELWEQVAEEEGFPLVYGRQDCWVHMSFNGRVEGTGRQSFLFRWVAVGAEFAKQTGADLTPEPTGKGFYTIWEVRDPRSSGLGGRRTEVTGRLYVGSQAPNAWVTVISRAQLREHRLHFLREMDRAGDAYQEIRENPEFWVRETADLPPREVSENLRLFRLWGNVDKRERMLQDFYAGQVADFPGPGEGLEPLERLRDRLAQRGVALIWESVIEQDPALFGQVASLLSNDNGVDTLLRENRCGWGLELRRKGDRADLAAPPAGPEPHETYRDFVYKYLRPRVDRASSPAVLLREDGVYALNSLTGLWELIDKLWMPEGLGAFFLDRKHLALALMIPAAGAPNREQWWDDLARRLDPRTLRQEIPYEADGATLSWGYIGKTIRDPSSGKEVPASFIVPAAGLEEGEQPDAVPSKAVAGEPPRGGQNGPFRSLVPGVEGFRRQLERVTGRKMEDIADPQSWVPKMFLYGSLTPQEQAWIRDFSDYPRLTDEADRFLLGRVREGEEAFEELFDFQEPRGKPRYFRAREKAIRAVLAGDIVRGLMEKTGVGAGRRQALLDSIRRGEEARDLFVVAHTYQVPRKLQSRSFRGYVPLLKRHGYSGMDLLSFGLEGIYEAIRTFKEGKGPEPGMWVDYTVGTELKEAVRTWMRKERKVSLERIDPYSAFPEAKGEDPTLEPERREMLQSLWASLDPEQIRFLEGYYFLGKNRVELAEEFGLSKSSVTIKIQKAIRAMRAQPQAADVLDPFLPRLCSSEEPGSFDIRLQGKAVARVHWGDGRVKVLEPALLLRDLRILTLPIFLAEMERILIRTARNRERMDSRSVRRYFSIDKVRVALAAGGPLPEGSDVRLPEGGFPLGSAFFMHRAPKGFYGNFEAVVIRLALEKDPSVREAAERLGVWEGIVLRFHKAQVESSSSAASPARTRSGLEETPAYARYRRQAGLVQAAMQGMAFKRPRAPGELWTLGNLVGTDGWVLINAVDQQQLLGWLPEMSDERALPENQRSLRSLTSLLYPLAIGAEVVRKMDELQHPAHPSPMRRERPAFLGRAGMVLGPEVMRDPNLRRLRAGDVPDLLKDHLSPGTTLEGIPLFAQGEDPSRARWEPAAVELSVEEAIRLGAVGYKTNVMLPVLLPGQAYHPYWKKLLERNLKWVQARAREAREAGDGLGIGYACGAILWAVPPRDYVPPGAGKALRKELAQKDPAFRAIQEQAGAWVEGQAGSSPKEEWEASELFAETHQRLTERIVRRWASTPGITFMMLAGPYFVKTPEQWALRKEKAEAAIQALARIQGAERMWIPISRGRDIRVVMGEMEAITRTKLAVGVAPGRALLRVFLGPGVNGSGRKEFYRLNTRGFGQRAAIVAAGLFSALDHLRESDQDAADPEQATGVWQADGLSLGQALDLIQASRSAGLEEDEKDEPYHRKGPVPTLIFELEDSDEEGRSAAALELSRMGEPALLAVTTLLSARVSDSSSLVQRSADIALGRLAEVGPEARYHFLEILTRSVLNPKNAKIRSAAVQYLSPECLAETVSDKDVEYRLAAIHALGMKNPEEARQAAPALVKAFTGDVSATVRKASEKVLVQLGLNSEIREAREQQLWERHSRGLSSTRPEVRESSAAGLGRMGARAAEAIPALEKAAADRDRSVREAAVRALRQIRAALAAKDVPPSGEEPQAGLEEGSSPDEIQERLGRLPDGDTIVFRDFPPGFLRVCGIDEEWGPPTIGSQRGGIRVLLNSLKDEARLSLVRTSDSSHQLMLLHSQEGRSSIEVGSSLQEILQTLDGFSAAADVSVELVGFEGPQFSDHPITKQYPTPLSKRRSDLESLLRSLRSTARLRATWDDTKYFSPPVLRLELLYLPIRRSYPGGLSPGVLADLLRLIGISYFEEDSQSFLETLKTAVISVNQRTADLPPGSSEKIEVTDDPIFRLLKIPRPYPGLSPYQTLLLRFAPDLIGCVSRAVTEKDTGRDARALSAEALTTEDVLRALRQDQELSAVLKQNPIWIPQPRLEEFFRTALKLTGLDKPAVSAGSPAGPAAAGLEESGKEWARRVGEAVKEIRQNVVVLLDAELFEPSVAAGLEEATDMTLLGLGMKIREVLPWPKKRSADLQVAVVSSANRADVMNTFSGWKIIEVKRKGGTTGYLARGALPWVVFQALVAQGPVLEIDVTHYMDLAGQTIDQVLESLQRLISA